MTVAELFNKIRRRKIETQASTFKPYRELLIAVIEEKEIDDYEAEEILNQHQVDRQRFEADVETMRKRLESSRAIDAAKDAEKIAAQAESKIADVLKQREELHLKTQPLIAEAAHQRDEANNRVMRRATALKTLASSVLDPEILERAKELTSRRKELSQERSQVAEVVDPLKKGSATWGLNHNLNCVAELQAGLSEHGKPERVEYCKDQIKQHQTAANTYAERVEAAEGRLSEINRSIEQVNDELEKLNQQKLVP